MPEQPSKFFLTTPIYYVNARPHIGHAYTTIAADVLARRHRLLGDDVFFLTGTDEHGQKIERSAAAAGVPPQQFADEVAASFAALWQRMGITHNKFIRTTDAEHKRGVQKLFRTLQDTGAIYLDSYTGAYCVSDETFVDLPAGTPCPDCGRPLEIVTEENYFFKLSAWQEELINKIESGELSVEPESRRNEVLSFIRGEAVNLVAQNLPLVENETFREMVNRAVSALAEESDNPVVDRLINEGKLAQLNGKWYVPGTLKDLSISRTSFKWGIPVPDNPQHVIYVWLDALVNYITAVGYGADTDASLTAQQREAAAASFAKYWPADLHLVGKEIIRFHCVYWPAFLLAAGIPLPKKIQAHGWLLFEESKMSKSRGNIVRTETILDAFGDHYRTSIVAQNKKLAADPPTASALLPEPDKRDCDLFAADVLRYFLLREIPFGQDGSFSFDALITRYNADLANGYGNLVSRVMAMIEKYFNAIIPAPPAVAVLQDIESLQGPPDKEAKSFGYGTQSLIEALYTNFGALQQYSDETDFDGLLLIVGTNIKLSDGYLTHQAPWKLQAGVEGDTKRSEILYTAAESIRIITALLHPVMPHTTRKVWAQLGLDPADLDSTQPATSNQQLATLSWGGLKPGTKLGALAPIFPRAPKELAQVMSDIEAQSNPAKPAEPSTTLQSSAATTPAAAATTENSELTTNKSPLISIDDFAKVDLRVARVLVAERIPKADKLLRLEVDLGYEKRQILAGIAQFYEPEKLIGRKVVIVANLAPRKMRGLESQGMVVAASIEPDGAPALASFLEDVEIGARLK